MKKFTRILAAAAALMLTLSVAGCNNESGNGGASSYSYPSFINPQSSGEDNPATSEKYVVNVTSEGGMKLDGVQIALKNGNTVVRRGIAKNGRIEFSVPLGEYSLEIDENSLPAGYYLDGDTTYTTNSEKREVVNIRIPSKVINASGKVDSYAVGNIMRDFTFTDVDGRSHTLSTLLQTKKAVVLNFFFTSCGPCNSEFPHLQSAYATRKATANDIEVLGICTTSMGDTDTSVASKKDEHHLTFPVGLDRLGLCSAFGIGDYPTTIVIDRYGMIAAREMGGQPSTPYWSQMFSNFASSGYVQDIKKDDGSGSGNGSGSSSGDRVKPNVQLPPTLLLEQAALSENTTATFTADKDEYSWPWLNGSDADGSYIYSANTGVDNSYAIVHANVTLKEDDMLSFEYYVSSEAGADYLHVLLDGVLMSTGYSGGDGNWHTVNLYVSDRDKTVDLAFVYQKDAADPDAGTGDDVAKIRNISAVKATPETVTQSLDVMRVCASGKTTGNRYANYVKTVMGDDGFYHKDTKDGPLVYMSINNVTPWSDLHGKTMTASDGTTYQTTIFSITEKKYLEIVTAPDGETKNVIVTIGNKNVTEAYTTYVLIMNYMPAPYYLIPVTAPLKEWADALIADCEGGAQHADEWLEFCYYYDHYGPEHDAEGGDGATCKVDVDYTKGLTKYNAYTAYLKDDPRLSDEDLDTLGKEGRNKAIINFPLQLVQNGSYYKFKAGEAGVYQIRSYTEGCSPTVVSTTTNSSTFVAPEPKILVYDKNGEYMTMCEVVNDFDAYMMTETYEGFNMYLTLEADQEVYLYLATKSGTRSYYDFEITYKGETYEKLMICSLAGGAWTWIDLGNGRTMFTYLGIEVMYDESDDRYYAVKNGQPDREQPVYIDMIYNSFFLEEILDVDYAYRTLEYMIRDGAFRKYIYNGIDNEHPKMLDYLGEALSKDENDPLYGLVPANQEIVTILNKFIDTNAGGMGEGNGWLAWAVYNAKMG